MKKYTPSDFELALKESSAKDRNVYKQICIWALVVGLFFCFLFWPFGLLSLAISMFSYVSYTKLKDGAHTKKNIAVVSKEHWFKTENVEDENRTIQYDYYWINVQELGGSIFKVYLNSSAFELLKENDTIICYFNKANDLVAFARNEEYYLFQDEHTLSDGSKRKISTAVHQTPRYTIGWQKM